MIDRVDLARQKISDLVWISGIPVVDQKIVAVQHVESGICLVFLQGKIDGSPLIYIPIEEHFERFEIPRYTMRRSTSGVAMLAPWLVYMIWPDGTLVSADESDDVGEFMNAHLVDGDFVEINDKKEMAR